MFELEILHALAGHKKRQIDTSTTAGKKEAKALITELLRSGVSIIYERPRGSLGKNASHYVKGFDEKSGSLIVAVDKQGKLKDVNAKPEKGKATAVAPVRGGRV